MNSKTAGAVKATLSRKSAEWATLRGSGRSYLRNSMRDDRPVNDVPWMLVLRTLLVQARDLGGENERFEDARDRGKLYRVTNAVTQMDTGVSKSNTGE